MNPMTQEPDKTVEAVVLKIRIKSQYDRGGYSLGMRIPYHNGTTWWGIIDSEYCEETLSGFSSEFEGWWPLDIRSIVEREFRIYNKNRELVLSLPLDRVKPCKTCGHPLATHHKLHCETENCGYCNGWTCPEHGLVLCGCTYMGGPTPS